MRTDGFDSPEDAALDGFPREHCRVVASRADADHAYVLLNTGSAGQLYLYGVNCVRLEGRWFAASSGNGPGWSQAGADPSLGTLTLWGDAPATADMVRVEYRGQLHDEPVTGGAYLVVWWRQPGLLTEGPRVKAFRVDGRWTTVNE